METLHLANKVEEAARMAAQYIHSCQTEDGGYFFARVPPSSLRDSYFAVKTLQMLEQRPWQPEALENFMLSFLGDHSILNIHTLYLSSEIIRVLGRPVEPLRQLSETALACFKIENISRLYKLDVEVTSELEKVFEAASLSAHLNIPFDQMAAINLIFSLLNNDGGFGREGHSTLATTYYAVQTLALLNYKLIEPERVLSFLKKKEKSIYFLENHYYQVMTRSVLAEMPTDPERIAAFILDFQRDNGGFARAWIMGIPTLEYTYYAISILKQLGILR